MSNLKQLMDETVRYLSETTNNDFDYVEDFVMMDAFKAGMSAMDPSKYTLTLTLDHGNGTHKNLITVSIHDPIAIDLVRDQIIAIIAGLQQRTAKRRKAG